jgi:uncharacterized spore protein YtfJ
MVGTLADTFASLVESIKDFGVSKAYGSPVQRGGEEVIPVPVVSFGCGGRSEAGQEGASGGGGGGLVLGAASRRRTSLQD